MLNLLREALRDSALVQSFSGVRTRFGESGRISPPHETLAAVYGYCYARALPAKDAPLVLARDPRPTGRAITQALVRGFLAAGCRRPVDLGVITTPLAQAAVRSFGAGGGVIVTASHNPLSDNGWKFLTGSAGRLPGDAPAGALLSAPRMQRIVESVLEVAQSRDPSVEHALSGVSGEEAFTALVRSGSRRVHTRAVDAYLETVTNDWGLDVEALTRRPMGPLLLDPNGGAASGVASAVLEALGIRVYEMNAELGRPSHPIDTDSINPETGEHVLTRVARAVRSCEALFGVAFDYDADRGNVVLPGDTSAAVVAPQEISALNVALALARLEARGTGGRRVCVVASDATSGRVDRIAALFGAEVHRVETGEVNVVTKMRSLFEQGALVPVGVEGPNGGTVFAGSTCRDGVLTALSCALAVSGEEATAIWREKSGCPDAGDTLEELLKTLPAWSTPAARLVLQNPGPHWEVKRRMEERFRRDFWPRLSERFREFRILNYEGTECVEVRTGDEAGGWRVDLYREGERCFIFARGSRTEAGVWRVVADSPDGEEARQLLDVGLDLLRSLEGVAVGRGT